MAWPERIARGKLFMINLAAPHDIFSARTRGHALRRFRQTAFI
jgi:hypothetical protein